MKIVTLVGSLRKNGNTDQMVRLIEEHLAALSDQNQASLEVERIYLGDYDLKPCRGCRACFDRGEEKCPLKDGILEIKAKMMAADGLLVATPVYTDDVSGAIKNWLDRLAHINHRPAFAGKCAYVVATVGGSPVSHALRTVSSNLTVWGFHLVGRAGFKMGAWMEPEETRAKLSARAARIARELYGAVASRRALRPTFYSLMVFKIQQRVWQAAGPGSYDYNYWQEKGWLDPRCQFYVPHQASPIKAGVARWVGGAIGPFVS